MTSFTKTALAALMTGVLGLSAAPSMAVAQDGQAGAPQAQAPQGQAPGRHMQFHQQQGWPQHRFQLQMPQGKMRIGMQQQRSGRGGLLDLVCSENGAERLEIAFVRLSHRLDLTAEQQPLFDDLKATALTAQTSFSDTCSAARPAKDQAKDQASRPDMVTALKTRLQLDGARLEAMNTVLPKLEALYASLTDAQKAALQPRQRGDHMQQKPGQPGQPPAPSDAPAPDGQEG